MKKLAVILITILTLFSVNNSFADSIIGTSNGGWRSWTSADLNENLNPYWDGNSSDSSSPYTIGNYLTNTGGFAGGSGPGTALPYWGNVNGGAENITMQRTGGSNNVVMKAEVAGYANSNEFGYIDSSGSHMLFSGVANPSPATIAIFAPTSDYVFYLLSPDGLFKSDMSNREEYQHFAIFQESAGTFWIGMEDLKSVCSADKDYNDMIVKISQVNVPEPASIVLLAFGLIGLAGARRLGIVKF